MGNMTSSAFSNLNLPPEYYQEQRQPNNQEPILLTMPPPTQNPNPNQKQKAILSYFSPQPYHSLEKPYEFTPEAYSHRASLTNHPQASNNLTFEPRVVDIQDIRGKKSEFELDVHGFCFLKRETRVGDLRDEREVEERYLNEVERVLKEVLEKDGDGEGRKVRVVAFGWKVRSSEALARGGKGEGGVGGGVGLPTRHPHVDQSPEGALRRLKHHLPGEVDELLKCRFRILNVWRPLQKVTAWPLALCDARSVNPADLVPKEQIGKEFTGESYLATFSERHRWVYLGGMERREVVVMKIFDSKERKGGDGGVDACLHCSFELEGEEWKGVRESIEVRAMVFDELGGEEGEDGWVLV
ncbi:hypothetical protein V8E51_000211 [Hyaloscypha variabilis]